MSDNYFKVFQNPHDHDNWSKQQEYALIREDIDSATQKEFAEALMTLEDILGKHFLKSSHPHNPVRLMVMEKTLFRVPEIIEFAATLKAIKEVDFDLNELLELLGSTTKARREGVPFVEIAYAYVQQGFKVSFPVPPSKIGSSISEISPDIKIFNPETSETFFIEVTTLNDSKARLEEKDNNYFFNSQFHYIPPQHSFVGKQHIPIAKEDYPEISEIIAGAKQEVAEIGKPVQYSDSRFNFILVPKQHENELKELCEKYNLRLNTIDGLPINLDVTKKIIRKIGEKARQLPAESNGLIYIPITPLYFMLVDTEDIIKTITKHLSNSRFNKILGIVIYSKIVNNDKEESVEYFGRHIFRTMTMMNLCTQSLYIHNNDAEIYVSPETIEKIKRTF